MSLGTSPPPRGKNVPYLGSITRSPGMCLVRYQTIDNLTRRRLSPLLRIQLVAMWAVLAVAIFYLFQACGYQRAMKDIDYTQGRSIAILDKAVTIEQTKMNSVTGNVTQVTDQLSTFSGSTKHRLDALDQQLVAEERATRQLEHQIRLVGTSAAVTKFATPRSAATEVVVYPVARVNHN